MSLYRIIRSRRLINVPIDGHISQPSSERHHYFSVDGDKHGLPQLVKTQRIALNPEWAIYSSCPLLNPEWDIYSSHPLLNNLEWDIYSSSPLLNPEWDIDSSSPLLHFKGVCDLLLCVFMVQILAEDLDRTSIWHRAADVPWSGWGCQWVLILCISTSFYRWL